MEHFGTIDLITERLKLRRIKEEDGEEIFYGFRNQEGFLYYMNKEKTTLDKQKSGLIGIDEKYKNLDYYNWLITTKEDGKIIGLITFNVFEVNETVEVSYALDERYFNKGYMSEAVNKVKEFAFKEMNVNRFQASCCASNAASKRVIEKCGLNYEGTLKNYLKLKDGYHDMHMFGLVNEERV